jgi:hypothetical protein
MRSPGLGYGLWIETASRAIEKFIEIRKVMDAYSAIDNMTEEAFYKKHFYGHYNEESSLFIAKGPRGAITTVQSNAYPMEAEAIKKIFLPAPQAPPQQIPVTASALTLQLSTNIEKEVVAKTSIHNLRLLHICGKLIKPVPPSATSATLHSQRGWRLFWVNPARANQAPFLTYCVRH